MEEKEVQQNNMISNLPLLFANGYPTSLNKITEKQLEIFIPFMVQCSLGQINLRKKTDYSEPEWWPENIQFVIPFSKPKKCSVNWMEKMKEIVLICYQFHKSVFLLRFCNELASYDQASLRFINNYNSTTSLFDRRSNKLLVTFRNENMSYDQPLRNRKSLLDRKYRNDVMDKNEIQMIVEPPPFDIYLCDNCDAELYSTDALLEHEKKCILNSDGIRLCDSPLPHLTIKHEFSNDKEINELRMGFLLNFSLKCDGAMKYGNNSFNKCINFCPSITLGNENNLILLEKANRISRKNRTMHSVSRCTSIPFSSPAGQFLVRTSRTFVTKEYLNERLERIERFCHTPLLRNYSCKPKYFDKKNTVNNINCTFKKCHEQSSHMYVFPRRQFSQKRRKENFMFFNSSLIKKCRPITVRLKKITENEIKLNKFSMNSKLSIKLTRDTSRSSNWKISSSPSSEIIVDTIDLCSSDDDLDCTKRATLHLRKRDFDNSYVEKCCFTKDFKTKYSECNNNGLRHKKLKNKNNICNTFDFNSRSLNKSSSNRSQSKSPYDTESIKNCRVHEPLTFSSSLYDPNMSIFNLGQNADVTLTQHKPFRPSVFIFSNYVASPFAKMIYNNNEIISQKNLDTSKNFNIVTQNQENYQDAIHSDIRLCSVSSMAKKTINDVLSSKNYTNEILSYKSNIQSSNSSRNHNINTEITNSCMEDGYRTSKSLPLMQSFASQSRVISIDLTS